MRDQGAAAREPLPSCPTHGVCPPCREGWGHWNGSEYVPTLESTRAGRPVAHTEKGARMKP